MSISDLEKLRILLPHWIEHNHSHAAEFGKWSEVAEKDGLPEVAQLINQAVSNLKEAGAALTEALDRIGGPVSGDGHHHHH